MASENIQIDQYLQVIDTTESGLYQEKSPIEEKQQIQLSDDKLAQQQFLGKIEVYAKLPPAIIQYVIEKKIEEISKPSDMLNPALDLSTADAAALLYAVDYTTQLDPIAATVFQNSVIEQLRKRVLIDESSSKLYFLKREETITTEGLVQDIKRVSSLLENNEVVANSFLFAVADAAVLRSEEIRELTTIDLELEAALQSLAENISSRQKKFIEFAEATLNATQLSTDGQLTDETMNVLPKEITNSLSDAQEKNVEQSIEITSEQAISAQSESEKNPDRIWPLVLITIGSDNLLGTRNITEITNVLIQNKVIVPLLQKFGVNLSETLEGWKVNQFEAFNQILKLMDQKHCNEYFKKSVEKNFLFEVLQQCAPQHINKIFDPDGTQRFGAITLMERDHLELDQKLVDEMYHSLSESERKTLGIQEKKTVS
jgi:hypothetical protein